MLAGLPSNTEKPKRRSPRPLLEVASHLRPVLGSLIRFQIVSVCERLVWKLVFADRFMDALVAIVHDNAANSPELQRS